MQRFRVCSAPESFSAVGKVGAGLDVIALTASVRLEGTRPTHQWVSTCGARFFVFGEVHGRRLHDKRIVAFDGERASDLAILEDSQNVNEVEGRFAIIRLDSDDTCRIWTDAHGRIDVYFKTSDKNILAASEIGLLELQSNDTEFDEIGVAHSLVIYGGRPAKRHTWFRSVQRLGVGEVMTVRHAQLGTSARTFVPEKADASFGDVELNRYADTLLEAVRARMSATDNVIYLSSGWDSTALLACLVHLDGPKNVRAVIGRMRYSDQSGVINQFEIDRARAVAKHFKINLEVVELDYRGGVDKILDEARPFLRNHHFANMTAMNHWRLAREVAKTAGPQTRIFSGEMSDGAHNFGFSQFVSVWHPVSMGFREYGDKMRSYLFGPTFLRLAQSRQLDSCPVWGFIQGLNSATRFDAAREDSQGLIEQTLGSFFLTSKRLPFASRRNHQLLTQGGQDRHHSESLLTYISEVARVTDVSSIYATYLHLYNSFHWQGGTVQTLEYTAGAFGLSLMNPFHDQSVIELLSQAPEDWGRGLELRPTKYPLKWMLTHRVDYPLHLQVGPHAYIYDVEPGFSLIGELLYRSGLTPHFKQSLMSESFLPRINPEVFDVSYMMQLAQAFNNDAVLTGEELNDLASIAVHALVLSDD